MPKSKTNPKVDAYFRKLTKWSKELAKLRKIVLQCPLTEELKWGKPCYAYGNSNLVILYGLKESCAIGFLKGALLKDSAKILVQPGENSQSGRWIKFTSLGEIARKESVVKSYIHEAIEAEKAGLKVHFKDISEHIIPDEFQKRLDASPALKTAFRALTPGRQRSYLLYFSAPKQSTTREARIEKYTPQILDGKGMNDDYVQSRGRR